MYVNKDGRLGDGDYEFRGNAMPKLTYAFSGGFTYKKFSFDFMLQDSYGAKLFNAYKYTTLNDAISSFNRSEEILKALDGPAYDVPRISMIDDNDGFLYDRFADGSLSNTQGIYAYWVLHTDVLPKERLDRLVAHLADTAKFNRPHRIPSLSYSHPKYKANGRYWLGGVWPGTNYMVVSGLVDKGYRQLAWDIMQNHYDNVLKVFEKTGSFWEHYAPEKAAPGFMARKDFVG